jgi:PPM family protein phosphatase
LDHSWGYGTEQRLREENQDCHGVFEFPDFTLAVVCDGMGGHVGGAQASSLAVRTIHDTLQEMTTRGTDRRSLAQALEEAIQRANLVIYEAAAKNHRLAGMGTTVVAAAVTDSACILAHVGDSRAYLVRNGQVSLLTRDHTMVNLFVEAELLSPEDAATHPEAHVLSRSLGVGRQVDVEVSEPLPLVRNDVVVLCSDGVHGVVTDWELANVDWSAPHEAVRQILGIVANREGDDNATAVSIHMGTSFEDVPATPPPDPKRFEGAHASGATAVPMDDELATDAGDAPMARDPDSGGRGKHPPAPQASNYLLYESDSQPDAKPEPQEVVITTGQPATSRTRAEAGRVAAASQAGVAPRVAPAKRRSPALPMAVASLALVMALGATTLLLLPDSGPSEERAAEVVRDGGFEAPVNPLPSGTTAAVTTGAPALDAPLFAPKVPPGPRRLPHGSGSHMQAPPGGTLQNEAMNAVKRKDCPRAMLAIQRGMREVSPDHAVLYRTVWMCFTDAHQRPLMSAEAATFDDFQLLLPHFEGAPEVRRNPTSEQLQKMPVWGRPALDGIEFRLEQWSDDPEMHEVVSGLFGEPQLADTVAIDLQLIAIAADGLSRVPLLQRNARVEEAWSRRVYVLSRALSGLPGRMLGQHRRDTLDIVRQLLESSTTPRDPGTGEEPWPVPQLVLDAKAAGEGLRPIIEAPKPKPINVRDLEPELEIEDDPDIGIERAGNPPVRGNEDP